MLKNKKDKTKGDSSKKKVAWVISADMGYGHQRAVFPLRKYSPKGQILDAGSSAGMDPREQSLWKKFLRSYENISRVKSLPLIGEVLFKFLDGLLYIPPRYPKRKMTNSSIQVRFLSRLIRMGLCRHVIEQVNKKTLPAVTSFYAPAMALDATGRGRVYCIICDTDLNRVWVAENPRESRIVYFAPCSQAEERLRSYGISRERIFVTGFPLPEELLGGKNLTVLRKNLGLRLEKLDHSGVFRSFNEPSVKHFLGGGNYKKIITKKKVPCLSYAVGGAGAQKEVGQKIAKSLKEKIVSGEIRLKLIAGKRSEVRDYFLDVKEKVLEGSVHCQVVYGGNNEDYFNAFTKAMMETDILWTKPSELSFYVGLGIPIIMSPCIGAQERFNRKWLYEIQAGIDMEDPEYCNEWLARWLKSGLLAECAWNGFLRARKCGTYKILEILKTGDMVDGEGPLNR